MLVATTEFRNLADTVAVSLGLPQARMLNVAHPVGGITPQGVADRADAAVEEALSLLTA